MKRLLQTGFALLLTLQMMGCGTKNAPLTHTTGQSAPPSASGIEAAATSAPASEIADFPAVEANTAATTVVEPIDYGSNGEIILPTMRAGEDIASNFFKAQVERFNDKYAGQYKITLQQLSPGEYREKIKQLEKQKQLPPLIVDSFTDSWFPDTIIAKNEFYDLTDWINQNPDIRNAMIPESIEYNTTAGGKVVSLPSIIMQPIGLFYNTDMYKPPKPPGQMTMEEFEASLGDNKIAFEVAYDALDTMFFATALIAGQPGGIDLLNSHKGAAITDFTDPIFINAFKQLQVFMQKHAALDGLDGAQVGTANMFMSRDASILCNDFSMIPLFSTKQESNWSNGFNGSQVKSDVFPGNIVLGNMDGYSYWISSNARQDQIDCALAFMSFKCSRPETEAFIMAFGGVAPFMDLSGDFQNMAKDKPLLIDMDAAVTKDTIIAPLLRDVMIMSVSNRSFGELLPGLIDGTYSPEEFAKQLTDISSAACPTC